MRSNRVTITGLARELGLSIATVSNALNDKPGVAEATRERVRAAAARAGYLPNRRAAALRRGRTGIVSLHIPPRTTDLQFYMSFAFGLAETLGDAEFDLLLGHEGGAASRSGLVDAAVVVDWTPDMRQPADLLASGVPVVAADGVPDEALRPTVRIDADSRRLVSEITAAAATDGAQTAALLVTGRSLETEWQREVVAGVTAAASAAEMPLRVAELAVGSRAGAIIEAVESIVADGPLGVLVCLGERWAGVAHSVLRYGEPDSPVPRLASCSGDPITELPSPAITAIDLHPHGYGARCGELVLAQLRGDALPERVRWPGEIAWAGHWGPAAS